MRDCRRQHSNSGGCPPHRPSRLLNSYSDIVGDYHERYRQCAADDLRFYAEQDTLEDAVELASLARRGDGKRQSHQRRIPETALRRAHAELKSCDFSTCWSFDRLLQMVNDAIRRIRGIGELTVYDTACRIGAYLQLAPEKVYLHAGTRVGARALGLGRGTNELEIDQLPAAFHRLAVGEIEDCLCIYKDDLRRINGGA